LLHDACVLPAGRALVARDYVQTSLGTLELISFMIGRE
jgi:hypothetical protein